MLFVATAAAGDEEMKQRIKKHKASRPADWRTLEVSTHIGKAISAVMTGEGVVVIDCITLLINNIFGEFTDATGKIYGEKLEKELGTETDELIDCIKQSKASFVIVTNEVGLGIVPENEMARLYRDSLGRMNQRLAAVVDEVYLMVAGIPVRVKGT